MVVLAGDEDRAFYAVSLASMKLAYRPSRTAISARPAVPQAWLWLSERG
jgi:hypothetical protein